MLDTTDKKLCFVIAPIGDPESDTRKRSDQVLKHVIRPAAEKCGYEAKRADEIDKPGIITSQVIQHVVNDPLVIADLTERNPNVFYELAIRHALRKPLVQIIKKGEQIPFDVAATRTIYVDHKDLDSVEAAKTEIVAQINSLENDPADVETPISVSLDLQLLRQSDNPEGRSLADILSAVAELRASVGKLEGRIGTEDGKGVLDELRHAIHSLRHRLDESDMPHGNILRWRPRMHPEMLFHVMHGTSGDSASLGILIAASFFKDTMPWVYEMGVNAYRLMHENKPTAAKRAVQEFRRTLDFSLHGPFMRDLGPRSKDLYMLMDEMEPFWSELNRMLEKEYDEEK